MGKTPKPLKILVHPDLGQDVFGALAAQGHVIDIMTDEIAAYDIILGPTSWAANDELLDLYLDVAIKNARARRYHK